MHAQAFFLPLGNQSVKTVREANKLPFNVGWNIIIATAVTYIILAFATADGDNTTTCEISFLFQKNDILMANSLAQVFPKIFPAASTSSSSLPSGQFFHT